MDYLKWSREYWDEAARVRRRLELVRREPALPAGETEAQRARRLAILYAMYLDCVHTARTLDRRGRR